VKLKMPKLRRQTFETAIIERYQRRESSVEEALIEMYLAGVSVRRVEDITEALWGTRVSPGTVSNLNKKIYAKIDEWRHRPIEGDHPYVFLDGIVMKRSWAGEVRNVSLLVAIGVTTDGYREILGIMEGPKEDKSGWSAFLCGTSWIAACQACSSSSLTPAAGSWRVRPSFCRTPDGSAAWCTFCDPRSARTCQRRTNGQLPHQASRSVLPRPCRAPSHQGDREYAPHRSVSLAPSLWASRYHPFFAPLRQSERSHRHVQMCERNFTLSFQIQSRIEALVEHDSELIAGGKPFSDIPAAFLEVADGQVDQLCRGFFGWE
jgi:hypothetical protein